MNTTSVPNEFVLGLWIYTVAGVSGLLLLFSCVTLVRFIIAYDNEISMERAKKISVEYETLN